ncbi:uncharacterized protein LOC117181058 [Belonocnema kinseyi]|uniref:uncharacterized protein LOC117181058 n=1 Tax=Belonocnema kinseyi TaxID=2817044 RepID=UPI00143D5742|nr:uncharacterized protein LOC117181058 [Belonocnema kinseyi]
MVLRGLEDKKSGLHLRLVLQKNSVTREERRVTVNVAIQQEQNRYFLNEISALKNKKQISNSRTLIKLTPFFDGQLLRVGGHLKHSLLTYKEKHPVVLPPESVLTTLIIRDYHPRCLHGGVQLTLETLRQSYWILQGCSLVRSLIHRCIPCVRNRGNTQQQLMSDLSSITITPPERVFMNIGVDYAGPINVRTLKDEVTIPTKPGFLSSDKCTNSVGADLQLQEMFSEASAEFSLVATYLASHGTHWKFNLPPAPHFGGLYESAVESTKFHLRRVIGDSTLTFEEMTTVLTQIEACFILDLSELSQMIQQTFLPSRQEIFSLEVH